MDRWVTEWDVRVYLSYDLIVLPATLLLKVNCVGKMHFGDPQPSLAHVDQGMLSAPTY
jgi:hypothetical protein